MLVTRDIWTQHILNVHVPMYLVVQTPRHLAELTAGLRGALRVPVFRPMLGS